MDSKNTRKSKSRLFDTDNERFYGVLFRFVPLIFFQIIVSAVLRVDLYFPLFNAYIDCYSVAYIFMAIIGFTQLLFSTQRFYSSTVFGMIISALVSVEACLLLIFAQYHPILAVLAALLSAGAYFGIRYAVQRLNAPNRGRITGFNRKCRKIAFRLASVIVAVGLIFPAVGSVYKEFFSSTLTEIEWAEFMEWYVANMPEEETAAEDSNEQLLKDLSKWSRLDIEDRERLIRIIAELDKEYLKIDHLTIEVNTEKMDSNTLAYYEPGSNNIYVNYRYLDQIELEDAVITILHELHHAYVFHTIDTLDFDSPEVQNSFYYENARQWKENSTSYISGSISFDAYYNQPIERDARAYSEERASFYLAYAQAD